MVQVIDRMEDAGGAEYIKFRVYRSPVNPERILVSWQHAVQVNRMASIGTSQLGVPVEIEFQRAFPPCSHPALRRSKTTSPTKKATKRSDSSVRIYRIRLFRAHRGQACAAGGDRGS